MCNIIIYMNNEYILGYDNYLQFGYLLQIARDNLKGLNLMVPNLTRRFYYNYKYHINCRYK
jgi:hypothetical protein